MTCFYCDGSLHRCSENGNPKIEYGRWFPNCLYAKHLCGDRLDTQIQISKKQLSIEKNAIDKDTLIRLVNARLDLPEVQRLRKKYSLSVIKRCFEDQRRMNGDDFRSENDLAMACFILQKQIDFYLKDKCVILLGDYSNKSQASRFTNFTHTSSGAITVRSRTLNRLSRCSPGKMEYSRSSRTKRIFISISAKRIPTQCRGPAPNGR